ncbi:MAG: sterol desaturase family protein [Alphaproteobacteria bacterium]|nr:sterol desaturase family protein [Alphaproteobacteria bacterium]
MLPAKLTLIAFPVFLVAILAEAVLYRGRMGRSYPWRDSLASVAVGLGSRVVHAVIATTILVAVLGTVSAYRLFTVPLDTIWGWIVAFLAVDFAYYCWHAASHRVRLFWAAHSVHHSSTSFTFATAQRLAWAGPLLSGLVFFLAPLVFLGIAPEAVAILLTLNLIYQFFLHTELVRSMGPLELVLNTPSHHRVHHASNPEYLDKNFGGVLIIFDRLFGTFAAEHAPCRYGILPAVASRNPVEIALHEYRVIAADMQKASGMSERLHYLLDVPGWSPDGSRLTTAQRNH